MHQSFGADFGRALGCLFALGVLLGGFIGAGVLGIVILLRCL